LRVLRSSAPDRRGTRRALNDRYGIDGKTDIEDEPNLRRQQGIDPEVARRPLPPPAPSRPLVDQTGLTGRYDFKIICTAAEVRSAGTSTAPGVFTAMQEHLGLKLEPVNAPCDVLVIDNVERPSAN
jgi:hypothetical protein